MTAEYANPAVRRAVNAIVSTFGYKPVAPVLIAEMLNDAGLLADLRCVRCHGSGVAVDGFGCMVCAGTGERVNRFDELAEDQQG